MSKRDTKQKYSPIPVEVAEEIVQEAELRKRTYSCQWCGKIFAPPNSKAKLNGHLRACPNRIWQLTYEIGQVRFTIYATPWKRMTNAIMKMREVLIDHVRREEMFYSVLLAFKTLGFIRAIKVEKIVAKEEQAAIGSVISGEEPISKSQPDVLTGMGAMAEKAVPIGKSEAKDLFQATQEKS